MTSLSPVFALITGAIAGFGVLLILAGVRGVAVVPGFGGPQGPPALGMGDEYADWTTQGLRAREARKVADARRDQLLRRLAVGLVAGMLAWFVTGWPALLIIGLAAAAALPQLTGAGSERKRWIEKTQAIAAWTEMLRDTMAAADGVEEAIAATVPIAPAPIRREVAMLDARRRSEQPLPEALMAFGTELDHPSADLVVASLSAAAQGEGSDFVAVLTRLSMMTRDEVKMRLRVESSRAKMQTSTMIILSIIGVAMLLMAVLGRDYLEPYGSAVGQFVLALVALMLAAALMTLSRLSRITMPDRFTPRRRPTGVATFSPGSVEPRSTGQPPLPRRRL